MLAAEKSREMSGAHAPNLLEGFRKVEGNQGAEAGAGSAAAAATVPGAAAGGGEGRHSIGMVEEELQGGGECRFPNVRKTFWRSATWTSRSAPPSPKMSSFAETEELLDDTHKDVCNTRNSKVRASLPPLQPLAIARKSLEEWPSAGWDDVSDWTTPSTPGRRKIKNGLEIKIDLCSVQRGAAEPTEIQLKRDKFAFFDKDCSRIIEHIYLGSDAVARNREILRANGITHVLNCVGFVCPEYFKKELIYKTLWLQDSPCEDITSLLYDVFDYFEEVRDQGGRVLVHCYQGVSRSTSLVIAYLMWCRGRSFEDAFQDVKARRGVTNPNMGFACQLLQCQKRVLAAPLSPDSLLRMYRLAPHSPYDPLHLVPKTVNQPGPAVLDSRGAFVVHVPHAIYVWVGHACDPKITQAAQAAAGQVVRYERAQGPILIFREGQEDPKFWEALSKCPLSSQDNEKAVLADPVQQMDVGDKDCNTQEEQQLEKWSAGKEEIERVCKIGVGNKRVASFDVDYELFERASKGGVVPPVPSFGVGVATVPTRLPARDDGWSLLRRKFWGRELVVAAKRVGNMVVFEANAPEETATVDKQETNVPSPDTSMCSSSPHFSPMSTSLALSDASACSNSPFASPLSLSSTPSPSPSQAGSSPQLQPSPPSLSFNKSIHSTTEQHQLSVLTPVQEPTRKSSPISLAQCRGNASLSLNLPPLVDDPPPAPRGMSRKPKLPPILTTEKNKPALGVEENSDVGFRFEGFDELCSGLVNETKDRVNQYRNPTETRDYPALKPSSGKQWQAFGKPVKSVNVKDAAGACDNIQVQHDPLVASGSIVRETLFDWQRQSPVELAHKTGFPVLYEWPRMNKIEIFDADDLDKGSVFVLVAPDTRNQGNRHGQLVYVWVGSNLIAEKESEWNENNVANWQQVGFNFIEQMHMFQDIPVKVVREGCEPDEFWENFVHG